jgi:hypothetical protein
MSPRSKPKPPEPDSATWNDRSRAGLSPRGKPSTRLRTGGKPCGRRPPLTTTFSIQRSPSSGHHVRASAGRSLPSEPQPRREARHPGVLDLGRVRDRVVPGVAGSRGPEGARDHRRDIGCALSTRRRSATSAGRQSDAAPIGRAARCGLTGGGQTVLKAMLYHVYTRNGAGALGVIVETAREALAKSRGVSRGRASGDDLQGLLGNALDRRGTDAGRDQRLTDVH